MVFTYECKPACRLELWPQTQFEHLVSILLPHLHGPSGQATALLVGLGSLPWVGIFTFDQGSHSCVGSAHVTHEMYQ